MTVDLSAFCDAAFADQYDHRSTYGYLVFLCSNLISWCSKTTPSVKLSSTDAEYYALAEVTKEIMYLKQLLETLGLTVKTPILIYEDNQQAIDIANNLMIKSRTKHIDIKLHFIQELIENKTISLVYRRSSVQHADVMTKPLEKILHEKHTNVCFSGLH